MKVDIRYRRLLKAALILPVFLIVFLLSSKIIFAQAQAIFQMQSGQQGTVHCLGSQLTTQRVNKTDVIIKCLAMAASPSPSVKPSATPKASPSTSPSPTPVPTASPSTPPAAGEEIYGTVILETLGSCSASVHDRYVTRGPDGKLYRTWHPTTVPVDPTKPNGPTCTFAHEHGADPSTSKLYTGPIPFNYVARQAGMDEPHAGFKCFVANKGQKNDEGKTSLIDSLLCFHMGTGGPSRFTQRFHSMTYKVSDSAGKSMNLQAMADTGDVGSIEANPRQGKTVVTLGTQLGSPYEIWENVIKINNKGQTLAEAHASTAVFDPITVMDPANKARVVLISSPEASAIFKFNDPRDGFRGCERESYSGPLYWYNSGSTTSYQTDAFGSVTANGPLKQEISSANTLDFKASDNGQNQFKYRKGFCSAGLGLKN